MRDTRVTDAELAAARDYLVGVFPLRFETPGAVVGALGGLFVQRAARTTSWPATAARSRRSRSRTSSKAAQDHIHPDRLAIVAVGDADAVAAELEAAGFGELEVIARGAAAARPAKARGSTDRRRRPNDRRDRAAGLRRLARRRGVRRRAGRRGCRRRGRRGGAVELVGKVGNDGAGDAVVVALGRLGIGHAACSGSRPRRALPATRSGATRPRFLAADVPPMTDGRRADGRARRRGAAGRGRLLPRIPPRGRRSRPPTWTWHCVSCPGRGSWSSPTRSPKRRSRPGSRARPSPAPGSSFSCRPGRRRRPSRRMRPCSRRPADDDGSFGRLVGIFAGALDAGVGPAAAFAEAVTASGWEPVAD